jgi:hypothetical protein
MEYLTYLPPNKGETTGGWMDEEGAMIDLSVHVTKWREVVVHIPKQARDYCEGNVRLVEGGWYFIAEVRPSEHPPGSAEWVLTETYPRVRASMVA